MIPFLLKEKAAVLLGFIFLCIISSTVAFIIDDPLDFTEEGHASWYGGSFEGRPTATGIKFDKSLYTAAHRTLPLNSIIKVTLLKTGAAVFVKVDDRGPYVGHRILDLSEGAASAVGLLPFGVSKIRIEGVQKP